MAVFALGRLKLAISRDGQSAAACHFLEAGAFEKKSFSLISVSSVAPLFSSLALGFDVFPFLQVQIFKFSSFLLQWALKQGSEEQSPLASVLLKTEASPS